MLFLLSILYVLGIVQSKYDCSFLELADGGEVITPSDSSYDSIRFDQFAASRWSLESRNLNLAPSLIAIPMTESEIQNIIKYAKKCSYTISVRSGGHQYSGLSSCDGSNGNKCIQILMDNFNYIHYNKDFNGIEIESITAASGVKLADLTRQNYENNVCILHGTCPDVAVGGHYQSSAQSAWARSLGLGMDWIIRVKVITPKGRIRNLYKNSGSKRDRDLFWAILGGSPGSWGVVIEYEFKPIRDADYPHSAFYSWVHYYSKPGFDMFLRYLFNVIRNPYHANHNDATTAFVGVPLMIDPSDASTVAAHGMRFSFYWTGIDHGDINSPIPDHPQNKTWYQELVLPFKTLSDTLQSLAGTELPQLGHEGLISLSKCLYERSFANQQLPIPVMRYINTHAGYTNAQWNELFNDPIKSETWIQSIVNKLDEATSNPQDNKEIVFQFLPLQRNEGKLNDDIFISHDPMDNVISWPLRDVFIESDDWILFGNNDQYTPEQISAAIKYRDEFEEIMCESEIPSDIKSYAYSDLGADEYDINNQWPHLFNHRENVYRKLRKIKTRIDCRNIFKGPLTIPPKARCLDDDDDDDDDEYEGFMPMVDVAPSNDIDLNPTETVRISLSSSWVWIIAVLLIIMLSFNIFLICHRYKTSKSNQYASVKRIDSEFYDSENNAIINT